MTIVLLLIVSFAALVGGAELLVRGASRLASLFGVSPLVIGLTIVAFGTSAPEFVVTIKGSLTNHPDLVIGNCIGSNIFNVLFIIGLCAVISPLVVTKQLVRVDVPIMIGSHVLFLLLSLDGTIDRYDALLLLISFGAYYTFVIMQSFKENDSSVEPHQTIPLSDKSKSTGSSIKQIGFIAAGLILCILGAEGVVTASVTLARILGISELVIGLTVVSIGTSLPEVATSIVATIRGQRDIAIGNVVGSCIFNILAVIGLASLIAPQAIAVAPSVLRFDLPVAIVASLACLPIFFTDYKILRWEGLLFLFYYAAYTGYLILEAQQHDVLPIFSTVMLWFAIPLPAITLLVIVYRAIRSSHRHQAGP